MKPKEPRDSKLICHLTSVHPRSDTRIWIKEVGSIAKAYPKAVALLVLDGEGDWHAADKSVSILDCGSRPRSRILRALVGNFKLGIRFLRVSGKVAHFHDPELIPLGLFLKILGKPVVYDVHEEVGKQILGKEWIPPLIRRAISHFFSIFEFLSSMTFSQIVCATPAIAASFNRHKVSVVQNFPLLDEFLQPPTAMKKTLSNQFLYVGGLTEIRGVFEMIRSIDLMPLNCGKLAIAGSFQPRTIQTELERLEGWRNVIYAGQVNREKLADLMRDSVAGLVLFLPSPNHTRSQPNKLFEYMAASLPIIASDFPLWRAIISEAKCGFLVDPQNPQAIADAMTWILEHPSEALEMGRNGRIAVESMYNWETEAKKLLKFYHGFIPL